MNVLLTGATGFIGRAIVLALLDRGHRVTACCRRPQRLRLQSPLISPLALDFARRARSKPGYRTCKAWMPSSIASASSPPARAKAFANCIA
ncbi:NAD(P)H-binding protein [Methylomonas koyamae]|uniref:NAD(P)H-binding protein n=1 Tax=Methylomonas koyamae TaxID=702114 RepID=UPI00210FC600|nr:NAD(P)H-binding protein [Methylomonas koyamae]